MVAVSVVVACWPGLIFSELAANDPVHPDGSVGERLKVSAAQAVESPFLTVIVSATGVP
jgi:hypothetical protein